MLIKATGKPIVWSLLLARLTLLSSVIRCLVKTFSWRIFFRKLRTARHAMVSVVVASLCIIQFFISSRFSLFFCLNCYVNNLASTATHTCLIFLQFSQCCKHRTVPFFTLYGRWKLKLRYCPVNVCFWYINVLKPYFVLIISSSEN